MAGSTSVEFTDLLVAWGKGSADALAKLIPIAQRELHQRAKHYMAREKPGHTLQATALVNEVWIKLIRGKAIDWQDRQHFAAVCAQIMRRILVDFARAKRLREQERVHIPSLDEVAVVSKSRHPEILRLDDALNRLEAIDPRKARLVEMRYFAGMSVKETAAALSIAASTVQRDWALARAWLLREMNGADDESGAMDEN